jgi:hypothetical protein
MFFKWWSQHFNSWDNAWPCFLVTCLTHVGSWVMQL